MEGLPPEPPEVPPAAPPPPPSFDAPPPPPFAPPPAPVIPWEAGDRPALQALTDTVKMFFSAPAQAFRQVPVSAELLRPLAFAVIIGWIGMAVAGMWQILFKGVLTSLLSEFSSRSDFAFETVWQVASIFMAPLIILISLFIGAAIAHLMLMMLGGANRGFNATVRAFSYAHAPYILAVVPLLGGAVAGIWMLVLEIVGLSEMHGVSRGKAALAVLLPSILCCLLCVGGILILASMGVLAALGSR